MTQCCVNFVELTSSEVPSSAPKSNNHFTHRTSGLWGQRGKLTFRAARGKFTLLPGTLIVTSTSPRVAREALWNREQLSI